MMRTQRIVRGLIAMGLVAGILQTGPVTAAPQSGVTWTSFQDPNEQAFTVEVPKGWTIKGGLFRVGYSDARYMVDMISPDGKTEVRLGDMAIPPYALPTPTHPPGDRVDLGAQAQLTSAKYHTGQEFATAYAQTHFIRVCQKLDPQPSDANAPVKDYAAQPQGVERSTTGQATYTCGGPGGQRIAYAYARTNLNSNIWNVSMLASFLAPTEAAPQARNILLHCTQTFHLNPQWIQKQQQEDAYGLEYQKARQQQRMAALGQQVQQFERQMQATRDQVSSFERGQERQAAQVNSFDQALRGVTPTVDPYGNEREVWTGPYANYWRNGNGSVVNSTQSPGAGWTQLKPEQ